MKTPNLRFFYDGARQRAVSAKTVRELAEQVGYKSAQRIFRHKKGGSRVHVGYVIGPYWFIEYAPVERAA